MSFKSSLSVVLLLLTLVSSLHSAPVQSAIITLTMPTGARQLGMGEAGTALAEDASAGWWNPAGLGFGPLSDEWLLSRENTEELEFTKLTVRNREGFLAKSEVWAGSNKGLHYYNGKKWFDHHIYEITTEPNIRSIVRKFVGNNDSLTAIIQRVKEYNDVKSKEDENFLTELKLPWNLVIKHPITALHYDPFSEKLWVGTEKGLYRFDGERWRAYTSELGKVKITALTSDEKNVWVGREDGLFVYRDHKFKRRGKVLPSQHVTALQSTKIRGKYELYVGLKGGGVGRFTQLNKKKAKWNVFNLEDGLIDLNPLDITIDELGEVWVAHETGISRFTTKKWESILFENNKVHTVSTGPLNTIWIGTEKGVWQYSPVRFIQQTVTTTQVSKGQWTHYHQGNGLHNNKVLAIKAFPQNLWFVTAAGVEKFNHAKVEFSGFFEQLLPQFQIPDLFHSNLSATIPFKDWGTVGFNFNFVSFGNTATTNEGESDVEYNSTEYVAALSYGSKFTQDWAFGLNVKFIYSDLAQEPRAQTSSYGFDFAFLKKNFFIPSLDFGFGLYNIGPKISYTERGNTDPIPLSWNFGWLYEAFKTPEHRLIFALDYKRISIYEDSEGEAQPFYVSAWKSWFYPEQPDASTSKSNLEVAEDSFFQGVINFGGEYTYDNFFALRAGYLYDRSGKRYEVHMGLGFIVSEIMQLDVSNIKGISGNSVRDNQLGFNLMIRL